MKSMTEPTAPMSTLASQICNQIASVFSKPTSPGPHGGRDLSGFNPQGPNLPLRSGPRGPHAQGPLHEADPPRPPGPLRLRHDHSSPDLLIASAGPGSFPTVDAICWVARSNGARVLLLTAQPGTGSLASVIAQVPAQTMADDLDGGGVGLGGSRPLLPMGSLYEGALFEMVVFRLGEVFGDSPEAIRSRHTNLE